MADVSNQSDGWNRRARHENDTEDGRAQRNQQIPHIPHIPHFFQEVSRNHRGAGERCDRHVGHSKGPSSIRELLEAFPGGERLAYTTVQTVVYRLEAKKAVRRTGKVRTGRSSGITCGLRHPRNFSSLFPCWSR
jgi:hypothetical protein